MFRQAIFEKIAGMSILVDRVTKWYGSQAAVSQVQFELQPGEIVGFLGPNGAGKSTTLKMITGYLQPDEGSTFVGGFDVQKNALAAKKLIGYLPESNALYYEMYVKEYLKFVANLYAVENASAAIASVIERTGLAREQRKKIGQLSKGYKQRVGLAASLIHQPKILVLDEPMSGLDPNQIVEIRELIRQEAANKTVLFSSHILQEVEAICNRVIIIQKGKIVADAPLQELTKQASLEHVFKRLTNV